MSLERLSLPKGMVEQLKAAAEVIRGAYQPVRLISHYDADGICAAGIVSKALQRENVPFQTKTVKGLGSDVFSKLSDIEKHVVVFTDLGSSGIDNIESRDWSAIILDHHIPKREAKTAIQVNPHLHGIDGSYTMCGSSLAFSLAVALNENNWDLAPLALAGCIGDKQHMLGFEGPNAALADYAVEKGVVERKRGLNLDNVPVLESVSNSCDPYFLGLSGRPEAVKEFLLEADIDPNALLDELDQEHMHRLASLLSLCLLGGGVLQESIEQLVMEKHYSPSWGLYARELANYTNACGRMDSPGTGVALCMGDGKALEKAKALRKVYKGLLMDGLLKLEKDGPYKKEHVQFFYNEKPEFSGSLAGLGMQFIFDKDRPTFSLAVAGSDTKISARANRKLLSGGLDLAVTCNSAASKVGGDGGGHRIAAGATIPKGKEEDFMSAVDSIVATQLAPKEPAKAI